MICLKKSIRYENKSISLTFSKNNCLKFTNKLKYAYKFKSSKTIIYYTLKIIDRILKKPSYRKLFLKML